jgi:hypothetical protein
MQFATAIECAQPARHSNDNAFRFDYDLKGQNVVLIVRFDNSEVEWAFDQANHILARRWQNETVEEYKRGNAVLPHFLLLSSGDIHQYGRRPQ